MKKIYLDIINRLKSEVSELRWIDVEAGQLEMMRGEIERAPVAFPCALVELQVSEMSTYGDIQECSGNLIVRIASNIRGRTNAEAPTDIILTGLQIYDVVDKVYAALQGYYTDHFVPLAATTVGREKQANLFVYRQVYKIEFNYCR